MILTKQYQEKLLDKYITENPNATALEMQAFIHGVEVGILEYIKIERTKYKTL